MDLTEYNKKRNFNETPEPEGKIYSSDNSNRFVVQRHNASKLHYDLRLEISGSLKSWAIPKGPSMNPADKRLAVRTEDHPLTYLRFQGTIPKGNYGAGVMDIWDSGTFEVNRMEGNLGLLQQLNKGNLKLIFSGNKLKGNFALVRTGELSKKESWLLIKKKDAYATDLYYDAEALLELSHPVDNKYPKKIKPGNILKPMLATSANKIFNDPNWIYELKWDGYRVLAHITAKGVLLQSRNGINLNTKFPDLAIELESIGNEVILDGEVVIIDKKGVSQFGALQNYPRSKGTLRFYVFDMLYLNGHSMLQLSLLERKSLVSEVIEGLEITRYCDHIEAMGTALFKKAIAAGMEGVMAKAANSKYGPGTRTEKWLKFKAVESLDAFICGFTDSVNGGAAFGSLILGTIEKNELKYIGNCGSGFSEEHRKELLIIFKPYRTEKNPFNKKLALKGRKPNWMVPTLKCEVKYTELTKNGLLRNPVFKRLLNQQEVTKEEHSHKQEKQPIISGNKEIMNIDGFPVPITNLEKIYWPDSGYRKYDLIDYYLQVSEIIIPYLINRPQSLHRHPNGIMGESFYQKDNDQLPEWLETVTIYSKSSERDINYLLCQNTASLIYMANLGCIEINPWNSTLSMLDFPTYGIIDLDPPEGTYFGEIVAVALRVNEVLEAAGIKGYCKTSGAKGLHIYIPTGGEYSYEEVRNFIKLLCYMVNEILPEKTTLERTIKKRNGKIYLDYLQNRKGHTIASVYSVRPLSGAPVSTPLEWQELHSNISPGDFTINNVLNRIQKKGDLFAPVLGSTLNMEKALLRLETFGS